MTPNPTKTKYLPVWGFVFDQLAAEEPRLLDVPLVDEELTTGTTVVYIRVDFVEKGKRPVITGDFVARRISQVLLDFPGIDPTHMVLRLEKVAIDTEISKHVDKLAGNSVDPRALVL